MRPVLVEDDFNYRRKKNCVRRENGDSCLFTDRGAAATKHNLVPIGRLEIIIYVVKFTLLIIVTPARFLTT
jgi:hypothetical protein